MSLILRTSLTRPLTHVELDSNFTYLQIIEWVKKEYQQGQYVIRTVGSDTRLYFCVKSHTEHLYTLNGNTFTETNVEGGQIVTYWKQVYTNSSGGSVLTGATLNENFVLILSSSDGSIVSVDLSPLYSIDTYEPNIPLDIITPEKVGGIESGISAASLSGNTFSEMFDMLLYPMVNPDITFPNFNYSNDNDLLYVIGSEIIFSSSGVFDMGEISEPWNNDALQNYTSGYPNKYLIYYNTGDTISYSLSEIIDEIITTGLTFNYSYNYTITSGYQSWGSKVLFDEGPQPINNYGNNTLSPYPSGSLTSDFLIEGVYPIYATTTDIYTLTEQPLVSLINGNNMEYTLAAEVSNYRHRIQLPSLLIENRPLIGIYFFNTISNIYDPINRIDSFLLDLIVIGGVNYVQYTHNGILAGIRKIKLVF